MTLLMGCLYRLVPWVLVVWDLIIAWFLGLTLSGFPHFQPPSHSAVSDESCRIVEEEVHSE
jgi:hypothetical protein